MTNKLKISKGTSELLDNLSNRLNLRRNIICRLAVCRSLTLKESVKNISPVDSIGYEFNRYTLTGDYDIIFLSLIKQHEMRNINDSQYFSKYLRNHIERGIKILHSEYQKINSPIEFYASLFNVTDANGSIHF